MKLKSLCAIILLIIIALFAASPDINQWKKKLIKSRIIYSLNYQPLHWHGPPYREYTKIKNIPKNLIEAIRTTEDHRFLFHNGVDWIALIRAIKHLAKTGRKDIGASTITMQLAKNAFLNPEKTYWRKLNQLFLAIKIESSISKQEIMELYANRIYFGHGAYGVAAAAWRYYGKSLAELSLPELAMIAGLPQAPSRNNPINNLSAATKRRNFVLQKMLQHKIISQKQYNSAITKKDIAKLHAWPNHKALAKIITSKRQKIHTSIIPKRQKILNQELNCSKLQPQEFVIFEKDYIFLVKEGAIVGITDNIKHIQPAPMPCAISLKKLSKGNIFQSYPYLILGES